MRLTELIQRFESINLISEAEEVMKSDTEVLKELQQDQLLEGKGSDGDYLSPNYLEDPYFKSTASAIAYSIWKEKISPNKNKPKDVPDLFINGHYHNSILFHISGGKIIIRSNASFANDIERKYKGKQLGLNPKTMNEYKRLYLYDKLKQRISHITGLRLKSK